MATKRIGTVLIAGIVTACGISAGASQTSPPATRSVDNETRLFQRFAEDGAVTENLWLDGQFRFVNGEHADGFSIGPVVAVNIAEDFELGGRISLLSIDPDPGDTETGFSDLDLYGKVRLSTKPNQFAVGVLLKLPTGDEKKQLGTG